MCASPARFNFQISRDHDLVFTMFIVLQEKSTTKSTPGFKTGQEGSLYRVNIDPRFATLSVVLNDPTAGPSPLLLPAAVKWNGSEWIDKIDSNNQKSDSQLFHENSDSTAFTVRPNAREMAGCLEPTRIPVIKVDGDDGQEISFDEETQLNWRTMSTALQPLANKLDAMDLVNKRNMIRDNVRKMDILGRAQPHKVECKQMIESFYKTRLRFKEGFQAVHGDEHTGQKRQPSNSQPAKKRPKKN